nr:MAG TPA: hypothetical protein [Caudoviricetes sp.]
MQPNSFANAGSLSALGSALPVSQQAIVDCGMPRASDT